MNKKVDSGSIWLRSAYGSEAASMLSHLGPTENQIESAVERFYDSLLNLPAARAVLDNLSPDEFQHLRKAQGKYLATILSPDLSEKRHYKIAAEAGLRHCFVGVPTEVLAESAILYMDIASTLTAGTAEQSRLKSVLYRRMQFDLITQIEMYALVQHKRTDAYDHIAKQGNTGTLLDYMQDTLDTLLNAFDKDVAGAAFGRVKNGNYRHLIAKGRVPFNAIDPLLPNYPTVALPELVQKWFEEQPLIINSLHGDPEVPAELRSECMSEGIRSFGFFLLHDLLGAPKAYLLVCSAYPGYFQNIGMMYYWQQIADLTGINFDFMERSPIRRRHRLADGFRFRQLLAKNNVQMCYQPIIDPTTGRTVKLEALARLKDSDEIISPAMFLPAFGANQLRDLFDIGITEVMEDLHKLPDNPPLCSINLPPEGMLDRDWFKELPEHLIRIGASPEYVSLEILESTLQDDQEVLDQFFALKKAGYSILLDDVGAGESSLLRLVKLPISGIKIDQSFVRSLQYSFENLDLILSLRFLALQRGLECVAEGVENADIVDTLASIRGGGILFQGYAFAKPLSPNALADWLGHDAERQPLPNIPQSLYGWYSRHVERLFVMRNALYTISDLISIDRLQDAERCPLHAIIPYIGGDKEIEQAHFDWHASYANFVAKIQAGASANELSRAMEISKQALRKLIEGKIHSTS